MSPLFGSLEREPIDSEQVRHIWMALAKQADIRDSRDAALAPPRPTLFQVFWGWALQPVLGFFVAVYAIAALTAVSFPRAATSSASVGPRIT